MKIICVLACFLGWSLQNPANMVAHSEEEVAKAFDRGPIPEELLGATKDLEATAGQKSSREDAHERQHKLLEQYVRAGKERRCTEAMADIAKFDAAIVDHRNQANSQEENALRQVRDETATFVKTECNDTSVDKPAPQPSGHPFLIFQKKMEALTRGSYVCLLEGRNNGARLPPGEAKQVLLQC
jgi:hypothetical protein